MFWNLLPYLLAQSFASPDAVDFEREIPALIREEVGSNEPAVPISVDSFQRKSAASSEALAKEARNFDTVEKIIPALRPLVKRPPSPKSTTFQIQPSFVDQLEIIEKTEIQPEDQFSLAITDPVTGTIIHRSEPKIFRGISAGKN